MAQPLLQAQVVFDAPVAKVREKVSDFGRMPQWSPQCRMVKAFGPLREGTRTIDVNRRNFLFWPTTSTVAEAVPQWKVSFRVNSNNTVWSNELEPTANGTRLTESRNAENGTKAAAER